MRDVAAALADIQSLLDDAVSALRLSLFAMIDNARGSAAGLAHDRSRSCWSL